MTAAQEPPVPLKQRVKRLVIGGLARTVLPKAVTRTRHGVRMKLRPSDDIQFGLLFGYYERDYIAALGRLVPEGGTCLDVGANVGMLALVMARAAGPGGTVHAFEPDPGVHAQLAENLALNESQSWAKGVRLHRLAVSNEAGTVHFHRSDTDTHSGWGSVERFDDIATETVPVDAVTLDGFLEKEGLRTAGAVDLMKMDVEAHEFEALAGGSRALSEGVFRRVLIEFNGPRLAERGKSFADLLALFDGHGYRPGTSVNGDLLAELKGDAEKARGVCENFLFERGV